MLCQHAGKSQEDIFLTRKCIERRYWQLHVDELKILTESIDNDAGVCFGEKRHGCAGRSAISIPTAILINSRGTYFKTVLRRV